MLRGLLCLLGMTPTLAPGGSDVPMNWSADGRWVAYTVTSRQREVVPPVGWIFEDAGGAPWGNGGGGGGGVRPPELYRIYAADADNGKSVLLHESRGPLTSPTWRPDGRALAFGRIVREAPAEARFEVLIQDAPGENRVLLSRAITETPGNLRDWAAVVLVWSPDGRYLAIPDLNDSRSLGVIAVESGRTVTSFVGSSPAWSLDGTQLAFLRTERTSSLLTTGVTYGPIDPTTPLRGPDLSFGPPKHLFDLGQSFQPPVWSRDGKSVMAVARRMVLRGGGPSLQVDLLRVKVESGAAQTVAPMTSDPIEDEKAFRGVALSYDRDADQLFYALDVEGQANSIVWSRPKSQETVDRFHPVHSTVRVGSLAFSPDVKTLAIRFGEPGAGTVALYDVVSKRLTLLACDDRSRFDWMSLLIETAGRLWKASVPAAAVGGSPVDRPTILPVPGEIPLNHEVSVSLRRLGRLGEPLCVPPAGGAGVSRFDRFVAESRLYFDALRQDYPAALASLEALEARTSSPDQLERLLAVRAQLFLGELDVERADDTIGFLRTLENVPISRWESTPGGTVVTGEPNGTRDWSRYLAARLDDLRKSKTARNARPDDVSDPDTPEVPVAPVLQRLPLGRLPEGVFVIPRPLPAPVPVPVGEGPGVGFPRLRPGPVSAPTRPAFPRRPR